MVLSSNNLSVGELYTRKDLAKIWGYKDFNAIRRGIVIPARLNIAAIFVTENNSTYKDSYTNNELIMEGENAHLSDKRLIFVGESKGEILFFYRIDKREKFTYEGNLKLVDYKILAARPSHFKFKLE